MKLNLIPCTDILLMGRALRTDKSVLEFASHKRVRTLGRLTELARSAKKCPNRSNQTRLTIGTAASRVPAWSPDGSKMAFQSHRDGNTEFYVMKADGGGQTRATSGGGP